MPVWARLQLISLRIRFPRVTHFLSSSDGRTISAAVDRKPVRLTRT